MADIGQRRIVVILGRLLLAVAAASAVYAVSCLLRPPYQVIVDFSRNWARMAEQPFAHVGQFPHRLLAPLLAHLLGFGSAWPLFCGVLSVLLLTVVFWFCRERGSRPIDALLITLAAGLSGAVQVYKQDWTGYPDNLTFALLFLCALTVRKTAVFWLLHLANVCSHEVAFFALPWLLFLRRQSGAPIAADRAGVGITSAAYAGMRLYIGAHAAEQHRYTARYFAENHLFPYATLWLVVLVIAYWLVGYGPMIAVLGWHQRGAIFRRERLQLWLLVGGILGTFFFAYDFSRHGNILIVPLVLASVRFLEAGHRAIYAAFIVAMTITYRWLDPWLTHHFLRASLDCGVVEDYRKAITCALPRTWPMVLACVAALAALFAIGAWLWQRGERRPRAS